MVVLYDNFMQGKY